MSGKVSDLRRRQKQRGKQLAEENAAAQASLDCIILGGVANGALLRNIRLDATIIELGSPSHAKPLETSNPNADVQIESDTDQYEVHKLHLRNGPDDRITIFGIGVVKGKTLKWAFTQLVVQSVKSTTDEMIADGIIKH